MKKIFIVLFSAIVVFSSCQNASAINYSDELINNAVALTKSIDGGSAERVLEGQNSTNKPILIQFANLSSISIEYLTADAVTVIGGDGRMTIYLDKAFRNSPPEAIACLLEHETTHNDSESSVEEEVSAISREAVSWICFVQRNPSLAILDESKFPLIDRLNYLSEIYRKFGKNAIRKEVLSINSYSKLAFHSASF